MSEISASAKAKEKEKSGSRSGRGQRPTDPSFNMDELRALADLVDEHGLTDFEFENANIRVRLSKLSSAAPVQLPAQAYTSAASSQSVTPIAQTVETDDVDLAEDATLYKITSPIVGTFYSSPGPEQDPYVKEGTRVTAESVVCIVEAMKLMNEIQAETAGVIAAIYVENGQPVEYGQALFGVRK